MDKPSVAILEPDDPNNKSLIEYREINGFKDLNKLNKANGSQRQKRPFQLHVQDNSGVTEPSANDDRWDPREKFGCTDAIRAELDTMIMALSVLEDKQIICMFGNFQISKKELNILCHRNGWIHGLVLDWHTRHIMAQIDQSNCFAYSYTNFNYHKNEMNSTQGINPFAYETLFVPIAETNPFTGEGLHWILVVIRIKNQTIQIYDSRGDDYPWVIKAITKFLVDEARIRKCSDIYKENDWTQVWERGIPNQSGSQNCGMFVSQYLAFLANGVPLNFKEIYMGYFRMLVAYAILMHGKRQPEINKILSDALDEAEAIASNGRKVSKPLTKRMKFAITCSDKSGGVSPCSSHELFDRGTHDATTSAKHVEASSTSASSFDPDLDPTVSSNGCPNLVSSCDHSFMPIESSHSPLNTSFEASAVHVSAPNTPMSMELDFSLESPTSLSSISSVETLSNASVSSFTALSSREESPAPMNGAFSTGSQSPPVIDTKSLDEPAGDSSFAAFQNLPLPMDNSDLGISSLATLSDSSRMVNSSHSKATTTEASPLVGVSATSSSSFISCFDRIFATIEKFRVACPQVVENEVASFISKIETLSSTLEINSNSEFPSISSCTMESTILSLLADIRKSRLGSTTARSSSVEPDSGACTEEKSIEDYLAELPTYEPPDVLPDITLARYMELIDGQIPLNRNILIRGIEKIEGNRQTGELVLAKTGGFPHWPAIIVVDPFLPKPEPEPKVSPIKNKVSEGAVNNPVPRYALLTPEGTVKSYHVQYLGNEQFVDWVPVGDIDSYQPYEEYKEQVLRGRLEIMDQIEDKSDFVKEESVKKKNVQAWREAFYQADQLVSKSNAERLQLTYRYVDKLPKRKVNKKKNRSN